MNYYATFPTPIWQLGLIAIALVFVVFQTRIYGAMAFFFASSYSTLIVRIGPTTLVPVAFGAMLITMLLHLKQHDAFSFPAPARPIVMTYVAMMAWVLLRGMLGLEGSDQDLGNLLYLVIFINVVPFVVVSTLNWDDRAVRDFAKGFVIAVVVTMAIVWSRAMDSGLGWRAFFNDFWLTQWSGSEASPFVIVTGVTNYHWYSWNLGLAALAVLFVLRTRDSRYSRLYLIVGCVFLVACVQQIGLVGSRQSIISLLVAVLYTSWTRVRKALINVGAFLLVAAIALVALRALADLEPLPFATMRGADTITDAFDPAVSRGSEWQRGLEAFAGSPWIGVGFSSEESFSLGHNIAINTLANLGLVGFMLFALLIGLYAVGPLRAVLRQTGSGLDINRGLLGMQLFLVGTSLASGSLIASTGILWLGAIIIRRVTPPAYRRNAALVRHRAQPAPI
jgi:O-antigen ligase